VSTVVSGQLMPIIRVESVDDARDFYVDKLGFTHVMGMVGKDGQLDFVTVVLGGARVMFSRAPGSDGAPPRARAGKQPIEIYLQVDDVDGYHNQVKKKGVTISDPLTLQWWGDRTFKVMDPNGYEIWFYTNIAEPKPPMGAKLV
jgi:PhnB protein